MAVVTRIAPSPTGDPHVGTAYVGLFNYALAKRHGGRFVLRLEDTDRARYQPEAETRILEMMRWLGLTPDEGPDVGGPHGPYRQSERLELYRAHVDRLVAEGKAYRAFETPEELDALRIDQKRRGVDPGYDGRGRTLPADEQARRAAAGEAHVVRLIAPDEGATTFHDLLRGDVTVPNAEIRDAVLLKSDGYPTYHLANVVDDHLMGVTHVVRAEEWVVSTPLHVLLYRAFGWPLPVFAHLPLLRNPDANKSKISKRKMDTSVDSYREQGILPEALLNFLATMGWSMPDGREVFTLDEMIAVFDVTRVSLGGPVFDLKRLRHLNARYLREVLTLEAVADRVAPWLRERGFAWDDADYLLDVVDVLRPRAETLRELADQAEPFFVDRIAYDVDARRRLAAGQAYLEDLEGAFSRLEFFDDDAIDDLLHEYVQRQSVRLGDVMMPLRVALTGTTQAPGVVDLVAIMGRQRTLERLGHALQAIQEGLPDDDPERLKAEAEAAAKAAEAAKGKRRPPTAAEQG
ncbi:MAG: glutamate--tRNA ligase [Trueperaceae bacterium]|nr:glutamate--tRNA ligase [Trueperaceae bacterium]